MKTFRIDAQCSEDMNPEVIDWLYTSVGQMLIEGYTVKFWMDGVEMEAKIIHKGMEPGNA